MDFDAKEATVVYDATEAEPEQIVAAVAGAGFEVSVKRGPTPVKERP